MAMQHPVLIAGFVAILLPAVALGTEYIVGGGSGWDVGVDYQAWAAGKTFKVGDKLVFHYPVGAHNVFKVNGTGFGECIIPPSNQALTSGNDTVALAIPGKKWYICGVGHHCHDGQKLVITVESDVSPPTPAPTPPENGANGIPMNIGYQALFVGAAALALGIMI
ncbi:hypothetical protein ACLOJK_005704 [Asimina triloba]